MTTDGPRPYIAQGTKEQPARNTQNRSIKEWGRPGVAFTGDLHFTNLSSEELGALIWLLSMPEKHDHRLEGGKPQRVGSVRVELLPDDCEIITGDELAQRYRSLQPSASASVNDRLADLQQSFLSMLLTTYGVAETRRLLHGFLRAARGFPGRSIEYPRLQCDGPLYEWFGENEKTRRTENGIIQPG